MKRLRDAEPGEEHLVYAVILRGGSRLSMGVLLLTFLLYAGGLASPLIPIDRLPQYWGLKAAEYLQRAELPSGWGWVRLVGFGDYLNYVGIVMLASLSVLCLLAIFPLLLRRKDTAFILIVLAEIAVLFLAASGLLVVGH